jgi:hypothetical protein
MKINNKFAIGEFVKLFTDPEDVRYMVIFIQINPNGLLYGLSYNGSESLHFEIELMPAD